MAVRGERGRCSGVERGDLGGVALAFELLRDFFGEAFGGATLGGEEDGYLEGLGCRGGGVNGGAREDAGEEAVEPGALLGVEGRVIGNVGGSGRHG